MKTLGIVGGIGPESTIDYYRLLIAAYRKRVPDGSYPQILINSIDLKRMLDLIAANDASLGRILSRRSAQTRPRRRGLRIARVQYAAHGF